MRYYNYGFRQSLPLLVVIFLLTGAPTGIVNADTHDKKGYLFGVFPYLPSARIESIYSPIAEQFEKELGTPVRLATRATFEKFRRDISLAKYDIIFIQPFDYARVASVNGYIPVARAENDLHAVFVSDKDSNFRGISDLSGLKVSMPPGDSAVSLLGLLEIKLANLEDVAIDTEKNHFSCMRQILIKKTDVCVTAPAPMKIFNNKSGQQLKVFAKSRDVASSLYAVHKRVPPDDIAKIQKMLLNLENSEHGKALLKKTRLGKFKQTQDEDYDLVRSILKELNKK